MHNERAQGERLSLEIKLSSRWAELLGPHPSTTAEGVRAIFQSILEDIKQCRGGIACFVLPVRTKARDTLRRDSQQHSQMLKENIGTQLDRLEKLASQAVPDDAAERSSLVAEIGEQLRCVMNALCRLADHEKGPIIK